MTELPTPNTAVQALLDALAAIPNGQYVADRVVILSLAVDPLFMDGNAIRITTPASPEHDPIVIVNPPYNPDDDEPLLALAQLIFQHLGAQR